MCALTSPFPLDAESVTRGRGEGDGMLLKGFLSEVYISSLFAGAFAGVSYG